MLVPIYNVRPFEIRILEFSGDISLGEIWVVEDVNCFTCGNGTKLIGEARGQLKVSIPEKHWFVKLVMSPAGIHHLTALKNLDPNSIEAISFAGTDLDDADLSAVSNFRLREIDLAETPISGTGLSRLKNRAAWLSISFRSARRLPGLSFMVLSVAFRATPTRS